LHSLLACSKRVGHAFHLRESIYMATGRDGTLRQRKRLGPRARTRASRMTVKNTAHSQICFKVGVCAPTCYRHASCAQTPHAPSKAKTVQQSNGPLGQYLYTAPARHALTSQHGMLTHRTHERMGRVLPSLVHLSTVLARPLPLPSSADARGRLERLLARAHVDLLRAAQLGVRVDGLMDGL
jgi:hypothetical protein